MHSRDPFGFCSFELILQLGRRDNVQQHGPEFRGVEQETRRYEVVRAVNPEHCMTNRLSAQTRQRYDSLSETIFTADLRGQASIYGHFTAVFDLHCLAASLGDRRRCADYLTAVIIRLRYFIARSSSPRYYILASTYIHKIQK